MGLTYDLTDVLNIENEVRQKVKEKFEKYGEKAVQYAKENGSYQDRTGNLRASNTYTATSDNLEIRNDADYASYVEAKGYEVLTSSVLKAIGELEHDND